MARSKNQRITSTVRSVTVPEPQNHSKNFPVQTLTVAKPKCSSNTSTVDAIAIEEDEITSAAMFKQNAAIIIKQEALCKKNQA